MEGSGKEEVDVIEFGQVIELPPEPATKQAEPEAVEVVQEGMEVAISGPSDVTAEKREVEGSSLVSGYGQKGEEVPVSDTVVESSSGIAGSVEKELDVDSSVQAGGATVDSGIPEVSEIPRSTEYQPSTTLTHQTRSSWMNCCGLLDALRGSNQ